MDKSQSITMLQFKEIAEELKKLEEKKNAMRSHFEKSTCELCYCFHWMMAAELNGRKCTILTVDICPELYANELKGMGFIVEEQRAGANNGIVGYSIAW